MGLFSSITDAVGDFVGGATDFIGDIGGDILGGVGDILGGSSGGGLLGGVASGYNAYQQVQANEDYLNYLRQAQDLQRKARQDASKMIGGAYDQVLSYPAQDRDYQNKLLDRTLASMQKDRFGLYDATRENAQFADQKYTQLADQEYKNLRDIAGKTYNAQRGYLTDYTNKSAGQINNALKKSIQSQSDRFKSTGRDISKYQDSVSGNIENNFRNQKSLTDKELKYNQAQNQSARQTATGTIQDTYNTQFGNLTDNANLAISGFAPYAQGGASAQNLLTSFLTGDPNTRMSDYLNTPAYQFAMDEGMRALEGSQAARGGLLSGAAVKEAQKYASGLASQNYNNYINQLMSQANMGQSTANSLSGIYNTLGQNLSSIASDRGINQLATDQNFYNRNQDIYSQYTDTSSNNLNQYFGNKSALSSDVLERNTQNKADYYNTLTNLNTRAGGSLAELYSKLGSNLANSAHTYGTNYANAISGYQDARERSRDMLTKAYQGATDRLYGSAQDALNLNLQNRSNVSSNYLGDMTNLRLGKATNMANILTGGVANQTNLLGQLAQGQYNTARDTTPLIQSGVSLLQNPTVQSGISQGMNWLGDQLGGLFGGSSSAPASGGLNLGMGNIGSVGPAFESFDSGFGGFF